jgi:2,3-bisphosphoglycerate-independent phosphoglycerate mutase
MDSQDVIIANFANLDMIGHTGELNASIKAVEIVDECVGKIYQKSLSLGTTMFVTADHGNIEKILDENNQKYTSHTLSLVPFLVTKKDIKLIDGKLSNIAPTILDFLNINIPEEMNEHSLIIR